MKQLLLFFILTVCLSSLAFAQEKDTVYVQGFYTAAEYGTLNDAIDQARGDGTINNKVFKLDLYEVYVLSRSIFLDLGENVEIVADKPGSTQESAPPQIVWTEEEIDRAYIIQSYGDITLKNIWVRFADFLGGQVSCSITFEDSSAQSGDKEHGTFEGVIFDYCPIGSEAGGAITVKADGFNGIFKNCYFRNLSDNHFRYYGRAVSFPYQSTGFHYDSLLFENCTFSNISRIVMQEGNEFGDNVHINHCTMINSIEWVFQSAGWINRSAITNSIFINPYLFGYRPTDLCVDSTVDGNLYVDGEILSDGDVMELFEDGLCDAPGGGLINGFTEVDSFGFIDFVNFTDQDRGVYVANNVYMYQDWMLDWFVDSEEAKELVRTRHSVEVRLPSPMFSENTLAYFDSVDGDGKKVYPGLIIDWETIYEEDPGFVVEPTNVDTLKLFIEGKWYTGLDIDWSYYPYSGFAQLWPLPEDLAYTNTSYQTAAMGGLPLGDLNWFPDKLTEWEAQRESEWAAINSMLDGPTAITELPGATPAKFALKQNYPNPFNPSTTIEYSVAKAGHISLKVFNTIGQEVATLYNDFQKAGSYKATFDGSGLASGVYVYQLKSGNVTLTKKLVLVK